MNLLAAAGKRWGQVLAVAAATVVSGCAGKDATPLALSPPQVSVSTPVTQVTPVEEVFDGRTESVHSVDIRSQVSGYLEKVGFEEGKEVNEGDMLFQIDPRPFVAAFNSAQGDVTRAEARVERLNLDFARNEKLQAKNIITQEEFDKVVGDRAEARAAVVSAKADLERARLNVAFTRITAPISGRMGAALVKPGNFVAGGSAGATVLANIRSVDKMHANFDVAERIVLHLQKLIREKKIKSARETDVKVKMILDNGDEYPHEGTIDFVDNRVDSATGSLRVRAIFPNPERILGPGLRVRIRLPLGEPVPALHVPERALGSDQGERFVYVVDGDNKVQRRSVTVGALQHGMRVIESGLKADERVIVNGVQRVREGIVVAPTVVQLQDSSKSPAS